MTQVKKAFQPVVDFLEANADATVSDIIDQVIELTQAKTSRSEGSTFLKDAEGNTVAIMDYYFKRWMPLVGPSAVEFGAKLKTATGFNTMCKAGVSAWTKQQRVAKAAAGQLLQNVAAGDILPEDIAAHQAEIEEARKAIEPTELGFETEEEVREYLANNYDVDVAPKA